MTLARVIAATESQEETDCCVADGTSESGRSGKTVRKQVANRLGMSCIRFGPPGVENSVIQRRTRTLERFAVDRRETVGRCPAHRRQKIAYGSVLRGPLKVEDEVAHIQLFE